MLNPNASRLASPAQEKFRRRTDTRICAAIVGQWPPREEFALVPHEPDALVHAQSPPPNFTVAHWVRRIGGAARTRFVEARDRVASRKVA